eukprot:GHVU01188797.1.p1 GENE.GHVU01188797.1~~GHVU01188797.1.p1  ORF type:complete len:212 (+),score=28.71 GHVU01188797.1:24-638(+)
MSATCAASLEELVIESYREALAGEVVGNFRRLRKVKLTGRSASKWYGSMAGSCALVVEELTVSEASYFIDNPIAFIRNPVGDFRRLRKVELNGSYASRWFSSISESCGENLEELRIIEHREYVGEVRGDLRRLRDVVLKGNHEGGITWFSSISERCAPTLEALRIENCGEMLRHPTAVPGDFERLKDFFCNGWTLSGGRVTRVL